MKNEKVVLHMLTATHPLRFFNFQLFSPLYTKQRRM